jgi:hypothetical protein
MGECDFMGANHFDEAIVGSLLKFDSLHRAVPALGYVVHPFQGSFVAWRHVVDLVPYMYLFGIRCRIPRNVSNDNLPVGFIEDMGV